MGYISLTFVSLQQNSHISFPNIEVPFQQFLNLFAKNFHEEANMWVLEAIQRNTTEFKDELKLFVKEHQKEYPQFFEVQRYFSDMPPNSFFIIHKGTLQDTLLFHRYWDLLARHHQSECISYQDYSGQFKTGAIFTVYNLNIFGNLRVQIGTRNKSIRICRFCHGKQGEVNKFNKTVSFRNKAHAISEGLGNKKTIILEECDACNDRFSNGIELSLIHLLSPLRSLYGLEGKGGVKTLKGVDFSLSSDAQRVSIKVDKDIDLSADKPLGDSLSFDLHLRDEFIPQDVYRCLCKFALSVIPGRLCAHFGNTINWINGEFDVRILPSIALLQDNSFFSRIPILLTYQRKTDDQSLPFLVGEFHYANTIFVFIVPYSSMDRKDFAYPSDYDKFWDVFNEFRKTRDWKFEDFQPLHKIKLAIAFKFDFTQIKQNGLSDEKGH